MNYDDIGEWGSSWLALTALLHVHDPGLPIGHDDPAQRHQSAAVDRARDVLTDIDAAWWLGPADLDVLVAAAALTDEVDGLRTRLGRKVTKHRYVRMWT